MENCLCNKAFQPLVSDYTDENSVLETLGKFNIEIQNIGDVTALLEDVGEIPPGSSRCVGISQLPCAIDIKLRFSDETGQKKIRLWSNKLVCFDWQCLNT